MQSNVIWRFVVLGFWLVISSCEVVDNQLNVHFKIVSGPETVKHSVSSIVDYEIPEENAVNSRDEEDCTFITTNQNDLNLFQPLLLSSTTGEIIFPDKAGTVAIPVGGTLDLYCGAGFAHPELSGKKQTATCRGTNGFTIGGRTMPIRDILCESIAVTELRKTSRSCYEGASIIEIGFPVEGSFITLMEVCHDLKEEVTHYVYFKLYPESNAYQHSVPRPPQFAPGGFYAGKDVNRLFTQVQQRQMVREILGKDESEYFDIPRDVYMARGHMAAKVDFIYAPGQWATFYFINVAPQWQTFNGGNWERVENGVRVLARDRDLELEVYTGTWGVMTLPDINDEPKPLYLAFDRNGNGLIPVPMIYYKIAIDVESRKGIVLVGVNNIHATLEQIQDEYILCNDVSDNIDWIDWDKRNILRGYSYACEVDEFLDKIKHISGLNVSGPLY